MSSCSGPNQFVSCLFSEHHRKMNGASIVIPLPVTTPHTPAHPSSPGSTTSQSYCCKYCCTVCNHQLIPLSKASPAAPSRLWERPGNLEGVTFREELQGHLCVRRYVYSCKIAFLSKEWCYLKNKQKKQKTRIANKFLNNVYTGFIVSSTSFLFLCFLQVTKIHLTARLPSQNLQRGGGQENMWNLNLMIISNLISAIYSLLPMKTLTEKQSWQGKRIGGIEWIIHKTEEQPSPLPPRYLERHKIGFEWMKGRREEGGKGEKKEGGGRSDYVY